MSDQKDSKPKLSDGIDELLESDDDRRDSIVSLEMNLNKTDPNMLNQWISIKLDFDRHMITLSSAGIGVLVSLLTNISEISIIQTVLFSISIFCFLMAVVIGVCIFSLNSSYLESLMTSNSEKEERLKKTLIRLDSLIRFSFISGIIFSAFIGISTFFG